MLARHHRGRRRCPAGVKKFFSQRKPAHVVLEASTHSRWVGSIVKKLGHEVTVADTRRLRLISHSDSKSDRTDAELLARLGRADPDLKLLRPIRYRGDLVHHRRASRRIAPKPARPASPRSNHLPARERR
jgi:hypothetical protein